MAFITRYAGNKKKESDSRTALHYAAEFSRTGRETNNIAVHVQISEHFLPLCKAECGIWFSYIRCVN